MLKNLLKNMLKNICVYTKNNSYEGEIFLPLCLQNTSEWDGKIFISKSAKRELMNVKFIMGEN